MSIDKNVYYKKLAMVSVNRMIMSNTSKCNKCNDELQNFSVFIGDDQKLSTLYASCCSNCLSIVVKDAIEKGRNTAEEQIKKAEDALYKESLEIVRKTKLKKLEELK